MRRWLEREWERRGGGALIFLPLTLVFAGMVAIRRFLYRRRWLPTWHPGVPVVVVGNITVGGTGKTPLVIAIVEGLRRWGWTPGVVARGYGRVPRREQDPLGVVRVYPDLSTPEHFGDEPVLISRRAGVPVYVSPDRRAAAEALLRTHPDVDVIVSDDGLQHYALERDVELAVVDAESRFGNGLLLPSGPLREPVDRLESVDAVVAAGGSTDRMPGQRRFTMRLANERFVSLAGHGERSPADFAAAVRGHSIAAAAGIGHPERFFQHLERLGVRPRRHPFPDHHPFRADDLRLPGIDVIVMTEKDAVKCAAFADTRMWFLRVDAVLPPEFDDFLLDRLEAASHRHGRQTA